MKSTQASSTPSHRLQSTTGANLLPSVTNFVDSKNLQYVHNSQRFKKKLNHPFIIIFNFSQFSFNDSKLTLVPFYKHELLKS